MKRLALLVTLLLLAPFAHAHLGAKDVFETVHAGPYILYVTVRPPNVIPGVATVEVRSSGAAISALTITPLPVTGEASKHPPAADPMRASTTDPAFYTGAVWMMASGTWQVRFGIHGVAGPRQASVPVLAVPVATLKMERSMGLILGLLGLFLVVTMAGIVAASVRESSLPPGALATPQRARFGRLVMLGSLALMALIVTLGAKWWNVEAASYAEDVYKPLPLQATLHGNDLTLQPGTPPPTDSARFRIKDPAADRFLLDHGKVMHLYAIREPGMDAVFHLHPDLTPGNGFHLKLPAMPPGEYRLYGDIVHGNGFPETLLATLAIPPGMPGGALAPDDAEATPAPLEAGDLGPAYKLPDGYTLVWDRPSALHANTAYTFHFELLNPQGKPASDIEPYLGMAGHAAFVKTDGTVFAHTHPEGSAAMADVMLADASMNGATSMPAMTPSGPLPATVDFPYGLPSPGRYRIFIQMKHGNTVETGAFDANVQP